MAKRGHGESGGETIDICSAADISGGVTAELDDYRDWSLFIHVGGAIDITVELSPDGGTTWYEIPESVLSYSATADDVLEIGYSADMIRLTGSNATSTTAQVRGVF